MDEQGKKSFEEISRLAWERDSTELENRKNWLENAENRYQNALTRYQEQLRRIEENTNLCLSA